MIWLIEQMTKRGVRPRVLCVRYGIHYAQLCAVLNGTSKDAFVRGALARELGFSSWDELKAAALSAVDA